MKIKNSIPVCMWLLWYMYMPKLHVTPGIQVTTKLKVIQD